MMLQCVKTISSQLPSSALRLLSTPRLSSSLAGQRSSDTLKPIGWWSSSDSAPTACWAFFSLSCCPGRIRLASAFVIAVAVALEVFQAMTPDRDPRLIDVLQKAAGGAFGVILAQTILAFLPRPPA
jgi:hypothetical protein